MTIIAIKRKLIQVKIVQKELNSTIRRIQELRNMAERITPRYTNEGGAGGASDKIGRAVARIVDMESELGEEIELLKQTLHEVQQLIAVVPNRKLRLILSERYCACRRWEVIAAEMGCSWQHIYRMHKQALKSIYIHQHEIKTEK